ncbi:DNA primase [uncultured Holdemanella sp.]|uniref:DNA primase n=1 Tax=uncultured Holdemanella sp. TaxID=1763549 RepID=UPI0025CF114E|nr:DNA primase [uncultured Holdemanella sp.]
MSWISEEDIKAIRQQADIVDVMSRYITLEKQGKNYKAICPFHDDHDPSLSISTDKQIFKCFVCGTGGNVFTFVQKIENISFLEAVCKVAELIHYPLHLDKSQFQPKVDQNQPLYDCIQSYIRFLTFELESENGESVKRYLSQRKINEDIIKRFEIGYAPESSRSVKYLKAKGFNEQILTDTGLIRTHDLNTYAVFDNRLMIPIHDENGNPVGFTARRLNEDKDVAKYINTSETKIYHKGNLIFNYHRAKEFAKKNKRCILVEGAMDVIAFEKADIHESIACLGTACTKEQMALLKRLNVPLVVCYDGDKAGKAATYKFGKLAVDYGLNFSIVKNTTGKDPDEIFNELGKDELYLSVHKTVSFVEFLLDYLPNQYDLDNYEDKKKFTSEMQSFIERTCTDFEKADYYSRIKDLTGFDLSHQNQNIPVSKKESRNNAAVVRNIEPLKNGRTLAEHGVLWMILNSKLAADQFKDQIGFFQDPVCEELSLYCYDMYRNMDHIDFDVLMSYIEKEDVRNLLVSLMENPFHVDGYNEDFFNDSLMKIKECTLQAQIDNLNDQIKNVQDPMLKISLASKKQELIIQRNEILHRKEG